MTLYPFLLDIVKYTVAGIGVVWIAFYLARPYLDRSESIQLLEFKKSISAQTLPLRLQAYERMAIFLERINPNILITRAHKSGMSARLLQSELTKMIRTEFEHNLSQQIYMSNHAWEMVKTAKEEITKLVNVAASKLPDTATGVDLSHMILQISQ